MKPFKPVKVELLVAGRKHPAQVLERPSMLMEEVQRPDGTWGVGKTAWNPMRVQSAANWAGEQQVKMTLRHAEGVVEEWTLSGATREGDTIRFSGLNYQTVGNPPLREELL